jgi:hypothetical protein
MNQGIFILSETITNPSPDRRTRGKWMQATEWKSGWRFSVCRADYLEREEAPEFKAFLVTFLDESHAESATFWEREGQPLIAAGYKGDDTGMAEALVRLVGLLRPSTDQWDAYAWLFLSNRDSVRDGASEALWELFKAGKVTAADIVQAQKDARGRLAADDS